MVKKCVQICNGCGRKFSTENERTREEVFQAEWEWGYFSGKDGERHSFCLCERCYDNMIRSFKIPVIIQDYL